MLFDDLKFLKAYASKNGLTKKFAFGSVIDGVKQLNFFNGETSTHIAYKGNNLKDGVLYSTSPATCGYGVGERDENGKCNVGVPNPVCVANKIYSENKCAIYFIEEIDLKKFKYHFTLEELSEILEKYKDNEENEYAHFIYDKLSKEQKTLLDNFIYELGKFFTNKKRVSAISVWNIFTINSEFFNVHNVIWLQDAISLWLNYPNTSASIGADFVNWYAINILTVGYITNQREDNDEFDYWNKIEVAMHSAKNKNN